MTDYLAFANLVGPWAVPGLISLFGLIVFRSMVNSDLADFKKTIADVSTEIKLIAADLRHATSDHKECKAARESTEKDLYERVGNCDGRLSHIEGRLNGGKS